MRRPGRSTSAFTIGDVQAFYFSKESQNIFGVGQLDGAVIAIENASSTPITGGVLTVNPPGGPEDSFNVGTVPAGKFVLVEPGISNDHGTNHTFFKVTGTLLDESDSGPSSNDTQFEFTGTQGTLTIDSGVFSPAATAGPSNDGTVQDFNFLGGPGDADVSVKDGFGPKVVANLTATPAGGATTPALPIAVEVGYADDIRPSPFFPNPWNGSPNTVFVGSTSESAGSIDAGAIRIINTTNAPITVNDVSLTLPNVTQPFDLWGSNVVPVGGSLIVTQTAEYNLDTSDFETLAYPLTYPDGETLHASKITITVNGVVLPTFLDTGHVLTTGGSDPGDAGANESQNWRPVGTTGEDNPEGLTSLITVTHNLPATGYTVDSKSISPATTSATATQLVWSSTDLPTSDSGPTTFQLTGTVANMAPGEVRQISTGTTVATTFSTSTGQQLMTTIPLAPVVVAADHIIGIDPASQTALLGTTVTYTVSLTNPLTTPETYTLTSDGLAGLPASLAASVTVAPGARVTTPLTVTVPLSASPRARRSSRSSPRRSKGAPTPVEGQLVVAPTVALPTEAVQRGGTSARHSASAGPGMPVHLPGDRHQY